MQAYEQTMQDYLSRFQEDLDDRGVAVTDGEWLAGPVVSRYTGGLPWARMRSSCWDNAHFPLDYGLLLREGVPGVVRRAEAPREGLTPYGAAYRQAIAQTYRMVQGSIRQHAERAEALAGEHPDSRTLAATAANCRALAEGAPQTFAQGVQLFWFLWRLRSGFTSCIGRLDIALWPLYERDVPARLSRDGAKALLLELWQKLNAVYSGDTLMNVMLSGVDEAGRDVTNDLTLLLMETTMQTRGSEPHLNARFSKDSTEPYLDCLSRMIAMGQGQGVLYNDDVMIPALVAHGVPLEAARCYANDGCTEITLDSRSPILFWQMEMVKTLELTLFRGQENPCAPHGQVHKWNRNLPSFSFQTSLRFGHDSGDLAAMASFDEVYAAFLDQLTYQTDGFLERIADELRRIEDGEEVVTSPFVGGSVAASLDRGLDPLRGGYPVRNYQLLSGSIPTVADALYAVKRAVFEDGLCTLPELLAALAENFEGREPLRQSLLRLPKYGNDSDEVDALAADIARRFCEQVEAYRAPHGARILPGIYNIDFHMFASTLGATPDGRRAGDLICDHFSPTPGRAIRGPGCVLQSAAKADLARGCAASPLYLTLPAGVSGPDPALIRSLMSAILALGLPLVSIAVYSRRDLEDAMAHPETHGDLIVRVWGYNARFVDLDEKLQRHVLERIL